MKKTSRMGWGFYLIIVLIAILAIQASGAVRALHAGGYTYNDFRRELQGNLVASVEILPNEEVPTGQVVVRRNDDTQASFYVSDVKEIEKFCASQDSIKDNVVLDDIQKPSWILTTLLPYVLGFLALFFLFTFMSAQNGGQGGGANMRMMDFGKSRATRINPDDPGAKHFSDVAGLQ